jgi:hypothetical protein
VDPELLRRITDPQARKDVERAMALAQGAGRASRRVNMQSMRTSNTVGKVLGALVLVAGAIAAGIEALVRLGVVQGPDSTGFDLPGSVALLLVPMGGFFSWFARRDPLPSPNLLANGARGWATVVEVKAVDGLTRTSEASSHSYTRVTVALEVQPESGPPFQIDHREVIDYEEIRRLQSGARVPVRLTPGNPRRMAIDWDAMGG